MAGCLLVSAVLLYNLYGSDVISVSLAFHIGFLLFGIISFSATACYRVRSGPEKDQRHAKSRYWATIVLAVFVIPFFCAYAWRLSKDAMKIGNGGIVSGKYVVRENNSSVMGFWVMQRVKLSGFAKDDPNLIYLLRTDLLKVGSEYEIAYSPRSRFILSAIPIR